MERFNETIDTNNTDQFSTGANDASQAKTSKTWNLTIAVQHNNATNSSNILKRISGLTHLQQQQRHQQYQHQEQQRLLQIAGQIDTSTEHSSYVTASIEQQQVAHSNESTLLLPTSKAPAA